MKIIRTVQCYVVLCTTVVHNDTHIQAVLKDKCWFRFRFTFFVSA